MCGTFAKYLAPGMVSRRNSRGAMWILMSAMLQIDLLEGGNKGRESSPSLTLLYNFMFFKICLQYHL
jgi:hypothetical protein